ncbi:MAG: hypothetical protein IJ174_02120 [Clostridia bacterium]|nr:hypothetical protein [Clostridia bacterium]
MTSIHTIGNKMENRMNMEFTALSAELALLFIPPRPYRPGAPFAYPNQFKKRSKIICDFTATLPDAAYQQVSRVKHPDR